MKVTVARGGRLAGEQDPSMQLDVLEQDLGKRVQSENLPLFIKLAEILRQQIPANFLAAVQQTQHFAEIIGRMSRSNRTTLGWARKLPLATITRSPIAAYC